MRDKLARYHEKEDTKIHARMLREAMVDVPDQVQVPAKVKAKKPAQRKRFKRR